MDKVKGGSTLLSMLTAWALEESVVTADSMRARGYGLPGRTHYAVYRFGLRDGVLAIVMGALLVGAVVGLANGGAAAEFVPAIRIVPLAGWGALGFACYSCFLLLPTIVNVLERARWRISLSRI